MVNLPGRASGGLITRYTMDRPVPPQTLMGVRREKETGVVTGGDAVVDVIELRKPQRGPSDIGSRTFLKL